MRMGRFLRQLNRVIADHRLLSSGDGVVLAVSGGPDSMALLHGLVGINQAHGLNLRLHVAHLNHRTRGPDSDGDAEFVRGQAQRLGLPVEVRTVDVPACTGPAGGGLEQAGRQARYAFFAELARRHDCVAVATGHHADDNAETILQRIVRGTGPRGLAGIPLVRPLSGEAVLADGRSVQLVRPLLPFRRRMITRVLQANGLSWREDASNVALEPTRNWLRHELIPRIAGQANPGIVGALLRLGELSGWVNAFLEETAARTLASLMVDRTDVQLELNAAALAGKREIVQAEVIRQAILLLGPRESEIGQRHLKAVMRIVADGSADGKQAHLPGATAVRSGGRLILRRRSDAPQTVASLVQAERSASLAVAAPGVTRMPLRRRQLVIELLDNAPGTLERFRKSRTGFEEMLDFDKLHPPLVVRARRPGDRFYPLGASGSKKIGDFLTDHKVSPPDRERVCVLCDQLGPIWVMPLRIDERVRVTAATKKIAHCRLEPMEIG